MKNKYLKHGIIGFCIGIAISVLIEIIISLFIDGSSFSYVSSKMLLHIDNNLIAAILQVMICGVSGAIIGLSITYYDINKWSLSKCFITRLIIFIVLAVAMYLMIPLTFIEYIVLFIATYFIIWNIQYWRYAHMVKKINEKLNDINGEDYKSDKKSVLKNTFSIIAVIVVIFGLIINYGAIKAKSKLYMAHSTDLSNVYIDSIKPGFEFDKCDVSKYTETDRFVSDKYNLIYEELWISEKKNLIDKVYGVIGQANVSINGKEVTNNLDEVVAILGENYIKLTSDSEQLLDKYVYVDKENGIKVSFVYRNIDSKEIESVILEKYYDIL